MILNPDQNTIYLNCGEDMYIEGHLSWSEQKTGGERVRKLTAYTRIIMK